MATALKLLPRSRQDFEETKLNRKGGTTLRYDEHYEAKYNFIEQRAAYHMKKLNQISTISL